jgi:hypothetical protein
MTNRGRAGKVIDVESLEKENDKGIESLAERVGLLKAVRSMCVMIAVGG